MDDSKFADLLDEYLLPPRGEPNPRMAHVEIVWVRCKPECGSMHMREEHGVEEHEVEEVLFEVPPNVEARQHPEHPNRTIFWGATRSKRQLFIVCEDWTEGKTRYLKPITAYHPDDGQPYWRRQS